MQMHVGYIGLGAMGSALACRLIGAHTLSVWDINHAAAAAFEKLGAAVAPSAAELARNCDVVVLCLPRSEDVREVIFGAGGLAEGLASGKIVIDQTSGIPGETKQMAQQLAERGIAMIDAPVSGGVSAAAAGAISIMASGPDDAYDRAFPILAAISPNVYRCGARVGDGQAMKLINNVLSAGYRLATLEVVAMGRKMGLSLKEMTDVINKNSGCNRTTKVMLQALVDGAPSASNFAMSLMLKDMNQATALGMECDAPMSITSIVRGLLQFGVNTLGAAAQLEDILGLLGSMAGTLITSGSSQTSPHVGATTAVGVDKVRIGYVGLGAMGGSLARRLMASYQMNVFDRRPEVMREFEAEGAIAAKDLASLARTCDVIMICVPTSAEVRAVLFDKGGLAEGLSPGKIVIDQTTGDPAQTRRIAADLEKLGIALVDATVSGVPRAALAGTIAIMCGGPSAAVDRVRPILESVSPNITYCGGTGNGHAAKLLNHAVAAPNRVLTYEAAALGFKYGLSLENMSRVINNSTGWSKAAEKILPALASGEQTTNMQLGQMVKDLKLASQMAMTGGAPMLIAEAARNHFEVAAHQLGGTRTLDAMADLFEMMADIKFGPA
jgi:3-hydroxyisobutyrate dehydrogenase